MLLEQMNWMDVERHLQTDKRLVFVLGATEEHGYLSLATDSLIPWEIARKSCEAEGTLLAPLMHYGFSHWALDFPGTISLSVDTYQRLIQDFLASTIRTGFRRFLFLNGHSGNRGAREAAIEAIVDQPDVRVWFYSWWELPETAALLRQHGGMDHANWAENFPFTRVAEVPDKTKDLVKRQYRQSASQWRAKYPEGVLGGKYCETDQVMEVILQSAVQETSSILKQMLA